MSENKMVSVLLFVENSDDDQIVEAVKNISEQTYKNVDLIVSSFKEENSEEVKKIVNSLFLNVQWINHKPIPTFINEALELAVGDIIFYRTINNVKWYPRHIDSHMEKYDDSNVNWCLSNLESKDIHKPEGKANTFDYRIENPPNLTTIIIDEVSHRKGIPADWALCITEDANGEHDFSAGKIVNQWSYEKLRGTVSTEISVIQWIERDGGYKETINYIEAQIGAPAPIDSKHSINEETGEIEIKRKLPTLVGNYRFANHNKHTVAMSKNMGDINSIAIKRTIGLGDVILIEPIIKKLRQDHPKAEITLFTKSTDIPNYFKHAPDHIKGLEEVNLHEDFLSKTEYEMGIDLDLSYESRVKRPFIDSYAEVANVVFEDRRDKYPQLVCDEDPIIEEKYIVVCGDGSGWPGKTWPLSYYENIILYYKNKGYNVIETGSHHVTTDTDSTYHNCDFKTLINLIKNCDLYIGADNGPMHIARSFNKKCVIIAGAALPRLTNPNNEDVYYLENHGNECLGLKHSKFIDLTEKGGLTFIPINVKDPSCGINDIKPSMVKKAVSSLTDKKISPDGNEMNYAFNIIGNLISKDLIEGFAYYRDDVTGIYWKEDVHHHPDQRLNTSQFYIDKKETVWEKNFVPIINHMTEKTITNNSLLDVGCNMGIFLDGYSKYTDDIMGIDLNIDSVTNGINVYSDLKDKLVSGNFVTYDFDRKFQTLLCHDIINNVSNPREFLSKCYDVSESGSYLYISFYDIDNDSFRDSPRDWRDMGVGEKISFFDYKTFETMLDESGFKIVEQYFTHEATDAKFLFCQRKD